MSYRQRKRRQRVVDGSRSATGFESKHIYFPLLNLPLELRENIYWYILPSGQRIFLDPEKIQDPHPYTWLPYGATKALLIVNKQIHAEVTRFIFTKNIVNLIGIEYNGTIFRNLSKPIHDCIRTLELFIHDNTLTRIAEQWKVMAECPNLSSLRLVFYHEIGWIDCFGELAQYIMTQDENLVLDMELYTSVYGSEWYILLTHIILQDSIHNAEITNAVNSLKVPKQLRQITFTASVAAREASLLLDQFSVERKLWAFEKVSCQTGPPKMTCLRFCKRSMRDDRLEDQKEHPDSLNEELEDLLPYLDPSDSIYENF